MAEARQKEMKVNITVVATKTFMAGLEPTDVAMLQRNARTATRVNLLKIAYGNTGRRLSFRLARRLPRIHATAGSAHGLLTTVDFRFARCRGVSAIHSDRATSHYR